MQKVCRKLNKVRRRLKKDWKESKEIGERAVGCARHEHELRKAEWGRCSAGRVQTVSRAQSEEAEDKD